MDPKDSEEPTLKYAGELSCTADCNSLLDHSWAQHWLILATALGVGAALATGWGLYLAAQSGRRAQPVALARAGLALAISPGVPALLIAAILALAAGGASPFQGMSNALLTVWLYAYLPALLVAPPAYVLLSYGNPPQLLPSVALGGLAACLPGAVEPLSPTWPFDWVWLLGLGAMFVAGTLGGFTFWLVARSSPRPAHTSAE